MSVELEKRLWTHEEYYKIDEIGLFETQRTELIAGEIFLNGRLSPRQATAIRLTHIVLENIFAENFYIFIRCPLKIGEYSEPEAHIAVYRGNVREFEKESAKPELVVEVAEVSLKFDQTIKASLLASADVKDYWIVDLIKNRLEIRRRPIITESAEFGFIYGDISIFTEEDFISPLAAPEAKIKVADLLP